MSALTMLQRIDMERKDKKLGEVKELDLDGCAATKIEGLTDEYSCLEKLSMANVGLTTLADLPALPALTELNASGNPIVEGLESLVGCPNLSNLNLSGNKLASISDLAPLASLENLTHLELGDCDLVSKDGYRKEVFALLPHLNFLDGLDKTGVEEANGKMAGDAVNGAKNGHVVAPATNEEVEEEDEEGVDEDDDEGEEDDEIGLSALQDSKDLEDDEEDYVPGEGEDDAEDDDEDEDEDEEGDEGENIEDEVADLSGAGVTGPRRAQKRPAADDDDGGVSDAKIAASQDD